MIYTHNYIINYMQQPLLLKPVCHVCTGELVVTGISSLSHGVITNLLSRGEDQPVVAGRRVPGCRCFRTMSGGPPPKKARVQHTCWICTEKIEWTGNQPIHLKDRVQTYWLHYNCRWSKSGESWVQHNYCLQDADTNEYIVPQFHPPWLVRRIREREKESGKQPPTHPL